jgi:uncharacterized membrane protein
MNPDDHPGFGPHDFGRGEFTPMQFGGDQGGGEWHWLVPLLFLVALTAMFAWMVLQSRRRPAVVAASAGAAGDPALDELRLRYARGEVSREDFVATEADLRGVAPTAPALPPEPPAAPPTAT